MRAGQRTWPRWKACARAWSGSCTQRRRPKLLDALEDNLLLAPIQSSVVPLPHQLYALNRAISRDRIRYLLADEVGLGKTIEAGWCCAN